MKMKNLLIPNLKKEKIILNKRYKIFYIIIKYKIINYIKLFINKWSLKYQVAQQF